MKASQFIRVRGARAHNLKNISVDIPRNQLVIITGVSGSGKSSLAFDTIYAEGQRRYVESLSSYARQFLQMQDKPDVDLIEGLSPAISIEQKTTSKNPRSTVATVTEIYDYLRLLFARIGEPHCYQCQKAIKGKTSSQIVDEIMDMEAGTKLSILAPIVKGQKGEHRKIFEELRRDGFSRVIIDGEVRLLEEDIQLTAKQKHVVDVIIDRLVVETKSRMRLAEAVELALKKGAGLAKVLVHNGSKNEEVIFSQHFACIDCGVSYAEIEPRTFSFNAPQGACSTCSGLGKVIHASKRFEENDRIPEGNFATCPECDGARLCKQSLHVFVNQSSIYQVCQHSIGKALEFIKSIKLKGAQEKIGSPILKEIASRLQFLLSVGLEYLTLDRTAGTLSGGEAQRIRLATQIGSALVGVLYVLDEPSIGLHQRDNEKLLSTLRNLRDLGNTVLVVEHDEDTILTADYVIDMGPGAGRMGGKVVAAGTPEEIIADQESLTGQYLSRQQQIITPKNRRSGNGAALELKGARGNNLKNIDVKFPLGTFTCVTGVSGSGKSSLVIDTLYRQLAAKFYKSKVKSLTFTSLKGTEHIDKIIDIDQSPIGRTPRSNPVTYTGVFDDIRLLFASLPEAAIRGYRVGRFSFNVRGGRCEACKGGGIICIEMNFLADIYVTCEVCRGLRFNSETLSVLYRGKSISDVLEMTVDDAQIFFSAIPSISRKLGTLQEVGLGYIHLGQQATTLSGGEAQRIKLSKELGKRATGRTFYILDEPTTGLHFHDVSHLLKVLDTLVDQGNTVVVIEHNLDVIKSADYVIDIGPEGGNAGGMVVACGTPEQIAKVKASHTGRFLRGVLKG